MHSYLYLYSNKIDVFTVDSVWTPERYRRVYNRNLKIYRSVDNKIDIQVRNSNEKPFNVQGSTLVFNIIGRESEDLVFQKDCTYYDATQGVAYVDITEAEMNDIEQGDYFYSVTAETRSTINANEYTVTRRKPLYIDSQYGARAVLEVAGDVLGETRPSYEINDFKLTNPATIGQEGDAYYTSTVVNARPDLTNPDSMHTFQFFTTNYKGSVAIEGSIEDQGASPAEWTEITSFIPEDNVFYKNIEGKWNWLRVKHTPNQPSDKAEFRVEQTILGSYVVSLTSGGRGYSVGDTITIKGSVLGGESTANDLTITVTAIGNEGAVSTFTHSGTSYNGVKTFVKSGEIPVTGTVDKILYR